jgi:single-strand DNA-binding protein
MFNKVIVLGFLSRDIELRYLPSGSAIAKSAVATSFKYKDSSGQQKDEVCFLDFNIFGRSAEIANQYLKKGSKVLLEGRLVFEQWTASDGSNRSKHSLRVDTMKMLDSKGTESNNTYNPQHQPNSSSSTAESNHNYQSPGAMDRKIPEIDIDEEEIPFNQG